MRPIDEAIDALSLDTTALTEEGAATTLAAASTATASLNESGENIKAWGKQLDKWNEQLAAWMTVLEEGLQTATPDVDLQAVRFEVSIQLNQQKHPFSTAEDPAATMATLREQMARLEKRIAAVIRVNEAIRAILLAQERAEKQIQEEIEAGKRRWRTQDGKPHPRVVALLDSRAARKRETAEALLASLPPDHQRQARAAIEKRGKETGRKQTLPQSVSQGQLHQIPFFQIEGNAGVTLFEQMGSKREHEMYVVSNQQLSPAAVATIASVLKKAEPLKNQDAVSCEVKGVADQTLSDAGHGAKAPTKMPMRN